MITAEIKRFLELKLIELDNPKLQHHASPDFKQWRVEVTVELENYFGKEYTQVKEFKSALKKRIIPIRTLTFNGGDIDQDRQAAHYSMLPHLKAAIRAVIRGLETKARNPANETPQAFIAHGGNTPALDKMKQFPIAISITPIIVEDQPSEDRLVDKQVDWCLEQCDCAMILATRGDMDSQSGNFIPRSNILIEVGRCQERFPGITIYLLEEDTKFPSNISEKV